MLGTEPLGLLDRMTPQRSDEAWLEARLKAESTRYCVLAGLDPVIRSDEARTTSALAWFSAKDIAALRLPVSEALFLGVDNSDSAIFAICIPEHMARLAPGGAAILTPIVDLRSLAVQGTMSAEDLSRAGAARSLWSWHLNARHCGHCGGTTSSRDGGWKRKCWACGHEWFPRSDPAVIMLVSDGERCLLGHAPNFGEGLYSTLAGFVEHGEDIETAVRREVFEESSIRVGSVNYHSSQPWPFPHSLMIGCHCEALTSDIKIDPDELTDARWFTRAEVTAMMAGTHADGLKAPGSYTIANRLISAFVAEAG